MEPSRREMAQATPIRQENLQICLQDFDEQIKRLQERVARAEQLSDFFAGNRPGAVAVDRPPTSPIGYVGELADRIRLLRGLIGSLTEEQGRVESLTIG